MQLPHSLALKASGYLQAAIAISKLTKLLGAENNLRYGHSPYLPFAGTGFQAHALVVFGGEVALDECYPRQSRHEQLTIDVQ
jgi:hypothetical protein